MYNDSVVKFQSVYHNFSLYISKSSTFISLYFLLSISSHIWVMYSILNLPPTFLYPSPSIMNFERILGPIILTVEYVSKAFISYKLSQITSYSTFPWPIFLTFIFRTTFYIRLIFYFQRWLLNVYVLCAFKVTFQTYTFL